MYMVCMELCAFHTYITHRASRIWKALVSYLIYCCHNVVLAVVNLIIDSAQRERAHELMCSARAVRELVCASVHCVYVLYDYVNVGTEPTRVLRQYQCIGKMCDVLGIEYIVRTCVCLT